MPTVRSANNNRDAAKSDDLPRVGIRGLLGFQVGKPFRPLKAKANAPDDSGAQEQLDRDFLKEELHRENFLKKLRPLLGERRELLLGSSTVLAVVAAVLLSAAACTAAYGAFRATALVGSAAGLALMLTYLLRQRMRETTEQIAEIDHELDRFKIDRQPVERRAQKLFQFHSVELKRYYDQTLRQGAYIFWVGLLCLIAGFVIIGIALAEVIDTDRRQPEKTLVAVVGLVGGVLSNFIGFIFMRMYSQTIGSLSKFHERLVTTHHLHFGNYLAARINVRNTEEQNRTLADMANALAGAQGAPAMTQQGLALVPVPLSANGEPIGGVIAQGARAAGSQHPKPPDATEKDSSGS